MNITQLEAELTRDEGKKAKPYKCTAGKTTIGIGRNLDDVGLSDDEIRFLLQNDINRCCVELDGRFAWWRQMSDARQRVLVNMCFNLGISRLLKFKNTLAAMSADDYKGAAAGMRNSLWAKQVGARAERLAKMMEAG
jgi:lysozyme